MFITNLFECSLRPLITRPTRVNPNSPTTGFSILDHIWASDDFPGANSYVLGVGITDHCPVCSVLSALTLNSSPIGVRRRPITTRGRETFSILLSNISIDSTNDINQSFGNYHSEIFRVYNVAFSLVVCSPKNRHPAPWMTSKLKRCIRKKARLHKMFLRGNISRGDYTVCKNRLTNAVRRTKALYYSKLFYENAKNQKQLWTVTHGILNKKKNPAFKQIISDGLVLTGKIMTDFVNDYFVNIAVILTSTLHDVVEFTCLSPPVMVSFFFLILLV